MDNRIINLLCDCGATKSKEIRKAWPTVKLSHEFVYREAMKESNADSCIYTRRGCRLIQPHLQSGVILPKELDQCCRYWFLVVSCGIGVW